LILQKLTDTLTCANIRTLQFKYAESDSIDIDNHIWTLSRNHVKAQDGYFLRNIKIVLIDVIPINVMDGLAMSVRVFRSLPAVTEQGVYAAVNLIERIGLIVDLSYKLADCGFNLVIGLPTLFQIRLQQFFFDRRIVDVLQIAEVGIAQIVNEPMQDSIL